MTRRIAIYIFTIIVCATAFSVSARAQFDKKEAFSQTYNSTDTTKNSKRDTTDKLFSFKELYRGLARKEELRIGTMFVGNIYMPGSSQIYNKDYWQLPIVYGGIGACAGMGGYYLHQYNLSRKAFDALPEDMREGAVINTAAKTRSTWFFIGAGAIYWASLLDGVACFDKGKYPHAGRATIFSILLPGLGQAYNGEYWKVPIYWGGLVAAGHYYYTNNVNYKRFKRIHNEATNPDVQYTGPISGETALWYRNVYRRYRDYSVVAIAAVYLLQVIDANIFSYMHDFEVTDDLSLRLEPTLICPDNSYAGSFGGRTFSGTGIDGVGMKLGIRF